MYNDIKQRKAANSPIWEALTEVQALQVNSVNIYIYQ